MSRHNRNFALAIFAVLALAVCWTMSGCASNQPHYSRVPPNGKGSTASTEIAQDLSRGVIADLEAAKPFTVPPASDYIESATAKSTTIVLKLNDSLNVIHWYQDDWGRLNDLSVVNARDLAAYHDRWIGDKTYRTIGWILGLSALASIGLLAWHFALGGTLLSALPFTAIFHRAGGLKK